jgi:hypothetical protein
METPAVAVGRHIIDENVPYRVTPVAALTQCALTLLRRHAEQALTSGVAIQFLYCHSNIPSLSARSKPRSINYTPDSLSRKDPASIPLRFNASFRTKHYSRS